MDTNELSGLVLREATIDDLASLVMLEERCFTVPWSKESFEHELTGNPFSQILVIPHPKDGSDRFPLVGYICVWLVFEEVRFLNLAIHPDYQHQGLAKRLIEHGLRLGVQNECSRGLLEVRQSNIRAINLYKSLKFKEYSTRKSYYTNPIEDAILMGLEPISLPLMSGRGHLASQ